MPSFTFWVFAVLDFTQKVQDPIGADFGGFGGNTSSKELQIELMFWPQVVLMIVQLTLKAFWKTRIFTEKGGTQSLSFWSIFNHSLPPEGGGNQK